MRDEDERKIPCDVRFVGAVGEVRGAVPWRTCVVWCAVCGGVILLRIFRTINSCDIMLQLVIIIALCALLTQVSGFALKNSICRAGTRRHFAPDPEVVETDKKRMLTQLSRAATERGNRKLMREGSGYVSTVETLIGRHYRDIMFWIFSHFPPFRPRCHDALLHGAYIRVHLGRILPATIEWRCG